MHVFIVNEKTFKYHLEYKFVGTGANDKAVSFLDKPNTEKIHHSTERNLVGMIADISRISPGDKVIFYLTGAAKFYGIFKVVNKAFYDKKEGNYLKDELEKMLSFRILIEPDQVYSKGITEHECLDSLHNVDRPHQMCWSLIYRKLKGNRGCTMIFNYEFKRIVQLLKSKNNFAQLNGNNFSYDSEEQEIIQIGYEKKYTGNQCSIDITKRLLYKEKNSKAFEVHLQAFILQHQDTENLKQILFNDGCLKKWIGNEVSCGVGMQRIDLMTICENDESVFIKIIELKQTGPYVEIINEQLRWYVEWCIDYVVPNYSSKNVVIQPIILAKKMEVEEELKNECETFGRVNENLKVENVLYVGFEVKSENINFERVF